MVNTTMAYTISYDGQNSGLQAGSIYGDVNTEFNISSERPEASLNQACMRDLRTTDPRDDKNRIEQVKGGLLKDSYRWIIDNESFKQWRYGQDSRLLWIRGDPGKGKTMLLCGIIDELTQSEAANVSFFFCQATDVRINSATAVLRGLIYSLVDKQPDLLSHVRRGYDQVGKQIFEDTNAWEALSKILIGILGDPSLPSTYLIIDALDECSTGLPLLLDFIIRNSCIFSSVKWIASSRNWPSIEEHLETVNQKTTIGLELNEASIAEAVEIYIQHRVRQLTELKQYNFEISQAVLQHLSQNSQRTFLWVALVSQELAKTSRWNTLAKLNTLPPGLTALYNRMLDHILNIEEARLCQNILAVILNVYRPITLDELIGFIDMPHGVSDDYKALLEIIALCGSFLTIRKHTISFIHQSAKEFLIEMAPVHLFKSRINEKHLLIFQLSLKVMFTNLRWNIYGVNSPGAPINQLRRPDPDPLAAARYQCLFWVDHVQEGASEASDDLEDGGLVDEFLQQKYLNWIEAISLLGDISEGIEDGHFITITFEACP
ncbi:uncharacterized protein N7503_000497 [Penicillium pulvis]|uniref:uncharacterized protein n=1 Tax=Penicillium pulvis TaxID=1562058 RepID=UPI0025484735|nr:uncharacterized protein N7503_000497 [Penicillium pulvis]KAJ5813747.1 hypothetical protein N7503_000497 [Penicillium pulvis]